MQCCSETADLTICKKGKTRGLQSSEKSGGSLNMNNPIPPQADTLYSKTDKRTQLSTIKQMRE